MEGLTRDTINKIEELVKDGSGDIIIEGLEYRKKDCTIIAPPVASPIVVLSLDSVVEFCNAELKGREDVSIVIEDEEDVRVYGALNTYKQRDNFLRADAPVVEYPFGQFLPAEEMIIKLQSCFEESEDKARVLAIIGNIEDNEVLNRRDDGVTQEVHVKSGITMAKDERLPNPVKLTPFRTFREVTQPQSLFILRARKSDKGVLLALFEADGNMWKIHAINDIRKYLKEKLFDFRVI